MTRLVKQALTGLAILAGLLIAYLAWTHPYNPERHQLDISFPQNVQLLSSPDQLKKDSLEFIYQGERVPNLVFIKLRFRNGGSVPIQETDFREGLQIIFPEDTKVIKTLLTQTQPLNEETAFQEGFIEKVNDHEIKFRPTLINSGEVFDLELTTTRFGLGDQNASYDPNEIKFQYKIFGISNINRVNDIPTTAEKHEEGVQYIQDFTDKMRNLPYALVSLLVIFALGYGIIWLIARSVTHPSIKPFFDKPLVQKNLGYGVLVLLFGFMAFALLNEFFQNIYYAFFVV